jgi:hypothetical protein
VENIDVIRYYRNKAFASFTASFINRVAINSSDFNGFFGNRKSENCSFYLHFDLSVEKGQI